MKNLFNTLYRIYKNLLIMPWYKLFRLLVFENSLTKHYFSKKIKFDILGTLIDENTCTSVVEEGFYILYFHC